MLPALFPPARTGAIACLGAAVGRGCPHPAPGRGTGSPARRLPTTSRGALLPRFLLSEPCECVCLLRSKLKKKKEKKNNSQIFKRFLRK